MYRLPGEVTPLATQTVTHRSAVDCLVLPIRPTTVQAAAVGAGRDQVPLVRCAVVQGESRLLSSLRSLLKSTTMCLLMAVSLWLVALPLSAVDTLADARERLRRGDYAGCVAAVSESQDVWNRDVQLLRVRALMITGPALEAVKAADQQARRWFRNIEALMLLHDALVQIGQGKAAESILAHIQELGQRTPPQTWSPADRVALGRAMAHLGEEPKRVLDLYFKSATTQDPTYLLGYLAAGELALSKNDYALAAQFYTAAAKHDADDADVRLGLARAAKPDDRVVMLQHIEAALRTNPNHVGSLLLKTEHEIDTEAYEQRRRASIVSRRSTLRYPSCGVTARSSRILPVTSRRRPRHAPRPWNRGRPILRSIT